jgi:hypothetical protein
MSFGERVVRQITGGLDDTRLPVHEPSELERAFMNYKEMEKECAKLRHEHNETRVHNGALVAEVGMLREALERSESDRIRLQAVSSTLMGRLLAINSVIGDAVKASIKHGIEAVEAAAPEEQRQDAAEVHDILERVELAASSDRIPRVEP